MIKNRIVLFDGFWDRDGMLLAPYQYLDTETGSVIFGEGKQQHDGELHMVYNVDVTNDRYVRLPTVEPYLRKRFVNEMNIPEDMLKKYMVDKDREIAPYVICNWEEFHKTYGDYWDAIHCMFEEMDIESAYYAFADPEARRMAREWFTERGIEIIE